MSKNFVEKHYRVSKWSKGYFNTNDDGDLIVTPFKDRPNESVPIKNIISELKTSGVELPVVLRFHDILHSQINELNQSFIDAIEEHKYKGSYSGVYPVKVNQLKEVVDEIVHAGKPFHYGLEAGSKAELLAVLSMDLAPEALIVLNGFKDKDYLKLALLGISIGKKCIVVVEKFSELRRLMELSKDMDVKPLLGFRARISTKGSGRWSESGGESAKFGLTSTEIINGIELLRSRDALDCLKLLHFHVGSQITDIKTVKDATIEAANIYCGMVKMGASMEFLDVGGGLGVDYDGSRSLNESSVNYDTDIYASNIVWEIKEVCEKKKVVAPTIVSESGRVITAYHSCVITEVFDSINIYDTSFDFELPSDAHSLVLNIKYALDKLDEETVQENFSDALSVKNRSIEAFNLGVLDLKERALIESIFYKICTKIHYSKLSKKLSLDDRAGLDKILASQYLCNLSIFQSLPDTWGVDQLIPILPISRLNEEPDVKTTLADITCDSDGKIKNFISDGDDNSTLRLHDLKKGEPYYLGFFLTGAYQDVMGDIHNLFGRLNEAHIFLDNEDETGFYIEEILKGSTCDHVLRSMQYHPEHMAYGIKRKIDRLVNEKKIPARKGVKLNNFFESCLKSYTYLR